MLFGGNNLKTVVPMFSGVPNLQYGVLNLQYDSFHFEKKN